MQIRQNFTIQQFRLIKTLSKERTLTASARKLGVTQPALSYQLKEIESHLGTTLYLRNKKRMVLTQAGEIMLQAANRILLEAEKAELDVSRLVSGECGNIRLGISCPAIYHWLPKMLESARLRIKKLRVQIVSDIADGLEDHLISGKIDIAITSYCSPSNHICSKHILSDEIVAVVSVDHPWATKLCVMPHDFEDQDLLLYNTPRSESVFLQQFLLPSKVTPNDLDFLPSTKAIIEMVKMNMGVTALPRQIVESHFDSQLLRTVTLTKDGLRKDWYACYIECNHLPVSIQTFIQCLTQKTKYRSPPD